jgi:hypothetical protein
MSDDTNTVVKLDNIIGDGCLLLATEDNRLPIQQSQMDEPSKNNQTIPLWDWIITQAISKSSPTQFDPANTMASCIRKLNVAFAIGKLLQLHKSDYGNLLSVDNFHIRIDNSAEMGWEVMGLVSFSPCRNVDLIYYHARFGDVFSTKSEDNMGRNVEVNIVEASEKTGTHDEVEESMANISELCYSFGVLLHQIFLGDSLTPANVHQQDQEVDLSDFSCFWLKSNDDVSVAKNDHPSKSNSMPSERDKTSSSAVGNVLLPLHTCGWPSTVSQIVQNLLDCKPESNDLLRPDNAYTSLECALEDLHLLLMEPETFLSERNTAPNSIMELANDKLFGRTEECTELKDAFCRVALNGRSEAFMVGGFSG